MHVRAPACLKCARCFKAQGETLQGLDDGLRNNFSFTSYFYFTLYMFKTLWVSFGRRGVTYADKNRASELLDFCLDAILCTVHDRELPLFRLFASRVPFQHLLLILACLTLKKSCFSFSLGLFF